MSRAASSLLLLSLLGCAARAELPDRSEAVPEAQLGRCGAGIDPEEACGDWREAVADCGGNASSHTSFPQLDPRGCYVPVSYDAPDAIPTFGAIPPGCGYPDEATRAILARSAARYDAIAAGDTTPLPLELACELSDEQRRTAAEHNARTARATRDRLHGSSRRYPYATISTFGFGHEVMSSSRLVSWHPGEDCLELEKADMDLFSLNRMRAGRAAAAYHGRLAPLVTVSGGAVHAELVEAFMLMHLLSCSFDVPPDAVLLDPCADHTHTNVRNTGSLLVAAGGRTGYLTTDSGLQGDYLQDWSGFEVIGGSIDQRALRDWGYLVGSWHQASNAPVAGYWFTPYRFWGDDDLSRFSCLR